MRKHARFRIRSRRENYAPVRNEEIFERATKSDDGETNRAAIDTDEPNVQRCTRMKKKKKKERKKRKRKIDEIIHK